MHRFTAEFGMDQVVPVLYGRQANWLAGMGLTSVDCRVPTNRAVNQAVCSQVVEWTVTRSQHPRLLTPCRDLINNGALTSAA